MAATHRRLRSMSAVALASAALAACSGGDGADDAATGPESATSADPDDESAEPALEESSTIDTRTQVVPSTGAAPTPTPTPTPSPTAPTISGAPGGTTASDQCASGELAAFAAFEIATGEPRWLRCEPGAGGRSVVAAVDGIAYLAEQVADETGAPGTPHLVAVDLADGHTLWEHEVGIVPAGPLIGAGVAVIGVEDAEGRAVEGLDPITGEVVWREPIGDAAPVAATESVVLLRSATPPDGLPSQPIVVSSEPPEPMTVNFYRGLDRASGADLWVADVRTPVDAGNSFSRPAIDGDTVVVSPGPAAVDATTGTVIWQPAESLGDTALGPIADGVLLIGGQFGPISGVDASTGELLWTSSGGPAYDDVWAVGDGAVYVVDRATSELVAYELADGSARWRQPWDGLRYSWPTHVRSGTLFAMWINLDAFSTADGSTMWGTNYALQEFPRMTGIESDDTTVVVAFSSVPSAGD